MRATRSRSLLPALPRLVLLAISLAVPDAGAQVSYKEIGLQSQAQRALPSTGPGSALLNPAALGETRLAFAQRGTFMSRAGYFPTLLYFSDDMSGFYQLAATLPPSMLPGIPLAFSAGFASHSNATPVDGSNAIYRESIYLPGMAVSWPAERDAPYGLSLGAALPVYTFNSFGAVQSRSYGVDLGILGRVSPWGHRLRMGLDIQHLRRPRIRLPDGRGHYALPGILEASMHWSTPGEMVQVHWERNLWEGWDESGGPRPDDEVGIGSWEVEVRPIGWLGLKVEKPYWSSWRSLGLTFQPVLGRVRPRLEFALSHEKVPTPPPGFLFGDSREEGLGLVQSMTLGVGI